MMRKAMGLMGRFLGRTPLAMLPVKVRGGVAKGAWWTLLPCSSYWRGYKEPAPQAALKQASLRPREACWDLGTHFGIYTVGMAMQVAAEGEVAGFEPDPVSFARCRKHVGMNHLNQVKLFNAAVSDEAGKAELLLYGG